MTFLSRSASLLGFALPLLLSGCLGKQSKDPATRSLQTSGGLSESRFPRGLSGATPAPTGAHSSDRSLEAGWYKDATKPTDKAPTYDDTTSGVKVNF